LQGEYSGLPPYPPKGGLIHNDIVAYIAVLVPLQGESHGRRAWQGVKKKKFILIINKILSLQT